MTDVLNNQPLKVRVGPGGDGALLDLPYAQLDQVRTLFDRNSVVYWWSEVIIPIDDSNYVTSVILSNNEDPNRVQVILDATP